MAIFSLLGGGIYLVFFSEVFHIKELSFRWQDEQRIPRAQVEDFVRDQVSGRHLLLLKTGPVTEQVLSRFLTVSVVGWKRRVPHRLEVKVAGRLPLAVVEEASGSAERRGSLVIDGTGLAFDSAQEEESLPRITLEDANLELGAQISSHEVHLYLTALTRADQANISVAWVRLEEEILKLQVSEGPLVWLPAVGEELPSQISTLQLILEKYRIEGKVLARVDLRFTKPVVRFR